MGEDGAAAGGTTPGPTDPTTGLPIDTTAQAGFGSGGMLAAVAIGGFILYSLWKKHKRARA
jgi:hypothetical protein